MWGEVYTGNIGAIPVTRRNKTGKLLRCLRHAPEDYGVNLDKYGYASKNIVCDKLKINDEQFDTILSLNYRRIQLDSEGRKVRARYGHTCKRIPYKSINPKCTLYALYKEEDMEKIKSIGLHPDGEFYVRLYENLSHEYYRRLDLAFAPVQPSKKVYKDLKYYKVPDIELWLADSIPPEAFR